jgi:hypothetical protein
MPMTTMTIAAYLALPAEQRPAVTYHGETVEKIYRDPTYPLDERYVIRLGGWGAGSKHGNTLLDVPLSEAGDVS